MNGIVDEKARTMAGEARELAQEARRMTELHMETCEVRDKALTEKLDTAFNHQTERAQRLETTIGKHEQKSAEHRTIVYTKLDALNARINKTLLTIAGVMILQLLALVFKSKGWL